MEKLLLISMIFAMFLSACSGNTETNPPEQENTDENEQTEDGNTESNDSADSNEEVNSEQELISELPEESHPDDWNMVLVNEENELPDGYEVELEEIQDEESIDSRIVDEWNNWYEASIEDGHSLFVVSGHRSESQQEWNFNYQMDEYMYEGDSEEEAFEKTSRYYAIPGHSEHHTGLAIDILDNEWLSEGRLLEEEYETQESQQWLEETMTDHGFILRYPEEKEEITGIGYEPWHFRYVGVENAKFMEEHGLVLEEYVELLNKREEMEN